MSTSSAELARTEVEARILVVDDEPEIAALLADSLREADPSWQVVAETDPKRALERLNEESFDCLIADLVMPSLSGLSLAQEARALDGDLAVIAITGRPTVDASVEALRAGFADFLRKPFDLKTLQHSVARSLQRRREGEIRETRFAELAEAKTELQTAHAQVSQKLQIASHDLVLSGRRLARQVDEMAMVADVAKTVMGVVELEELLGLCAELLGDRVSCRTSTVALYETHEGAVGLMVRAHPDSEETPALCWLREPIRSGVLCRAAQANKSIHLEDLAASNLVHALEREFWQEGRLLVIPMTSEGHPIALAVLHRMPDDSEFTAHDIKHVTDLAHVMGPAIRTAKLYHRQRCQVYASLEGIADAVEAHNEYLRGHSARVLAYAMPVAVAMEMSQCQIGALQIAARLHDLGRIVIPEAAVNHPRPLSESEWEVVRRHPAAGADFLKPLDFFCEVAEIIRAHHESYDGTGYPDLKAGEEIPLVARVITVADAFDAMTSPRPYREALTIEEAQDQVRRLAGQQFDPTAAEAFLTVPPEALREVQSIGRE